MQKGRSRPRLAVFILAAKGQLSQTPPLELSRCHTAECLSTHFFNGASRHQSSVELWAVSVCGWKTAASEKGEIKLDSSRNDDESSSLVPSTFTLLSLHKYYSELEQKAGTGIKILGLDSGD